jgi:Transposase IS66 family
VCLGKPFQPERKLACDIQSKAKDPAMISKLDRWCNWDNKNRPAIATRINSLSSLLLEDIDSPTKQWFADNLRHLPLPPVTPSPKVESSAYPGHLLTFLDHDDVEATNNLVERQLRPAAIAREVSCGNRTPKGARTLQILTSLAATCAQRATSFISASPAQLRSKGAKHVLSKHDFNLATWSCARAGTDLKLV